MRLTLDSHSDTIVGCQSLISIRLPHRLHYLSGSEYPPRTMPSQASLDLGPAGTGQAVEWDDTDLASLSLTARLRLANTNERLAGLSDLQRGERTLTDETLAAVLELQEATLLVQTISEANIAQLESARKAWRAEPTRDQGPGGRKLERAVPRPGAATEPELQLPPVEAIAHSPESPR